MNEAVASVRRGKDLAPLLAPRSVALVGASPTPGSIGHAMIGVLGDGGFAGDIHLVNPKYGEIGGRPCWPSIRALPEPVDLAVLGIGNRGVEAAFDDAVAAGAGAVVIFDSLPMRGGGGLYGRIRSKAIEADLPVLGGNCMGFYHFFANTHVSFQAPPKRKTGGITLISHSGSVFVLLAANDPRYRFNLVVSPGQEINASVSDYMNFALDQPSTRVLALFIETVRDPAGFVAALEKARVRNVPVVAMKVGRTAESARLAATHSGAIAGNDAAYEAVFDRHGVRRAETLDELMATALVLSQPHRPVSGGLGALTDSGGLRELMMDLAVDLDLPFAPITPETRARLAARLPPGHEPVNPVDAAGPLTAGFSEVFRDSLRYLMEDPNIAMGLFEFEARDDFAYTPAFLDIAEDMAGTCGKPLIVLNSFSGARNWDIAERLADAGVPLVNGVRSALLAVRHALAYREFRGRVEGAPPAAPSADSVARWRRRLALGGALAEAESLALLRDFGIPAVIAEAAADRDAAIAAAEAFGYPVALKTAAPGLHHKSDVDGVKLGLAAAGDVAAAYDDLASRLGPQVTIEPMALDGVELAFGMVDDPQFGPLVMLAAGGRLIEVLPDRCFALAPFDEGAARRMIGRLRLRPLLDGVRGRPAADIGSLARALAGFSVLVTTLSEALAEMDVNPVIAGPRGGLAVDALAVGKPPEAGASGFRGGISGDFAQHRRVTEG